MAKSKSTKKIDELAVARQQAKAFVKECLINNGYPVWDNAVDGKLEGMTTDTLVIPRAFNGMDIQVKIIAPAKKNGEVQYYLTDEDVESLENQAF